MISELLDTAPEPVRSSTLSPSQRPQRNLGRIPSLAAGGEVGGRVAAGGRDIYSVTLRAGEVFSVIVEQKDLDLAVTLFDPAGEALLTVDGPNGPNGPELLAILAPAAGRYRLELAATPGAEGAYWLKVESLGPASTRDRALASGLAFYARAEQQCQGPHTPSSDAALGDYRQALRQFLKAREPLLAARAARRTGALLLVRNEVDTALAPLRQAFEVYRAHGNDWERAPLYNDLGEAYRLAGESDRARELFERALVVSAPGGNPMAAAAALNNLGLLHASLGEVQKALLAYDRALAAWQSLGDTGEQARVAHNLGAYYVSLGRLEEGLDLLQQALRVRREIGDRRGQTSTLTTMGWARDLAGDFEAAVETHQQALPLRRAEGDVSGEVVTLDLMGRSYLHLGWTHQALGCLERALELEPDGSLSAAYTRLDLAAAHLAMDRREAALESAQRALEIFARLGALNAQAAALATIARAERKLGRTESARERLETALELVDSVRAQLESPWLRDAYFAGRQPYYDAYVDLLMQLASERPGQGHAEHAFEASERARARGLSELLDDARREVRGAAAPELLARERVLRAKIDARETRRRQLLGRHDPEPAEAVERELRSLLLEYEKLQGEIRAADPRLWSETRPLGLAEIQEQLLDDETLLLAFSLGDTRSFLWIVGRGSFESHELPARAVVETQARRAVEQLRRSRSAAVLGRADDAIDELSAMLLGSVASLEGRRLVILADGALHGVPFAALRDPATLGRPERRWLLQSSEIVYLPSVSVLAQLRRRASQRRPTSGLLAVVADPIFEPDDPRLRQPSHPEGASRPVFEPGWNADPRRVSRDFVDRFERLAATGVEAEAILSLAAPAKTLRLAGLEARRELVLAGGLECYRIVHFATHGLIDGRHPALSSIVLSLVDAAGRPREGMLRLHDLFDLRLSADLVVLSACRTALGKEVRGEGIVGLAHGFFYAGATRMMASLWNVDDRATAELMTRFYRGLLKEGRPPAQALRMAQLSMLEQGEWRAPYFWAGFVIQGEWR